MCKHTETIQGDADALYAKDPKLNKEDVEKLQEWMGKESHLPKISDYMVAMFLNSCYYGMEATKQCIEDYYTVRTHCGEFFYNRIVSNGSIKKHLGMVMATFLPKRTPERYLIFYVKINDPRTDFFHFNDVLKVVDMSVTLLSNQLGPQEGHVLIVDGAGLQLGHVLKMNLIAIKKFFFFIQEAMPVRLKQIHVLNVNAITEMFLNMVKPCLKKELMEQMYCHSKMESVRKCIPQECLPNDYGGAAGTIKELHEQQIENIEMNADFFLEDQKLRTDESKRIGERRHLEDFFGIAGTFKQLSID